MENQKKLEEEKLKCINEESYEKENPKTQPINKEKIIAEGKRNA